MIGAIGDREWRLQAEKLEVLTCRPHVTHHNKLSKPAMKRYSRGQHNSTINIPLRTVSCQLASIHCKCER
jgi:hypothetical protein